MSWDDIYRKCVASGLMCQQVRSSGAVFIAVVKVPEEDVGFDFETRLIYATVARNRDQQR